MEQIKNLLLSNKYKEAEYIVVKELGSNDAKINAQLWVFLGQALMHQGFGKAAGQVFNRAWLLDPNAQWVDGMKIALLNVGEGCQRVDIDKLLEVSKVTVTAGIIVKNEERCIEKCIKALLSAVDEIILIDTGSTDRTIEITQRYPKVKIMHFKWCDDFAAARNFGLSSVKTDWVVWIDADEELVVEDTNCIREVAGIFNEFEEPWLLRIGILSKVGDMVVQNYDVNRMFKVCFGFQFKGIIHEQLILPSKKPARIIAARIRVIHDGYETEIMKSKEKIERNLKLLEKMVEIDPNNVSTLFFYGRELFASKDYDKSEKILLSAEAIVVTTKKTESFGRLLNIYDILMEIYLCKNQLDNVDKICEKALKENEYYPNARFMLANIQAQKAVNLFCEAGENTKRAKSGFIKYRGLVSPNNQILEWQADLLLADLKRNIGDFSSALKYYERLVSNKMCGEVAGKHIESIKSEIRRLYELIK